MKKIIFAIITSVLLAGEIKMLGTYDVAPVGAGGTDVGFSTINVRFNELTGVNTSWYEITNYIGYFAIAVCLIFAIIGLAQLIRRKSLLRVDREILSLGGLFICVIACYLFFEKVIINYRPVILDAAEGPEASFPSSHTMIGMTVMVATAMIISKYVKSPGAAKALQTLCVLIAIVCVAGRLYSGVHWLTDIIGGVLLSTALLLLFSAVIGAEKRNTNMVGYKPKH